MFLEQETTLFQLNCALKTSDPHYSVSKELVKA